MISISSNSVSVAFGVETVLNKISFALNDGDRLGIVGVNGAGKTTLLRVLTGELSPTEGNIYISKSKSIGYFRQNSELESNQNVLNEMLDAFADLKALEKKLEQLQSALSNTEDPTLLNSLNRLNEEFAQKGGREYKNRCLTLLKKFGFHEAMWQMPISSLSGGQKTQLSLIKLILKSPDILILDEPTNHLDTDAVCWLEQYLRTYRGTVLIVSHDRYFLDVSVNKILQIEHGNGKIYQGNYSDYVLAKERDRKIYEHQYQSQQKEIHRIEAYIEQQRRWNRERNIIAAESREKMLARMPKLQKPLADPASIHFHFKKSATASANEVLLVQGLCKSFGQQKLFENISFLVQRNDRLFICGPNGCGKSTLIKIISGKLSADRGSFEFGHNTKIAYYDQENQELSESNTVLSELWNANPDMTQTQVRNLLASFLFTGDDVQKCISVLSGGEKARLTLAKLISNGANVLILDEPTNHLDIQSREVLEQALTEFDGTIIAVSHDRYFINKLSTRIIDLSNHSFFVYNGNFEEYQTYRSLLRLIDSSTEKAAPPESSAAKQSYLDAKRANAENRKKINQKKNAEKEISAIEARLEELNHECEKHATDYQILSKLEKEKSSLEERLLTLYEIVFDEN